MKSTITLTIERTKKKIRIALPAGSTVKDAISRAGVNPVEVVPAVNNEIVTESYKIRNNDKIELLSVVSGG